MVRLRPIRHDVQHRPQDQERVEAARPRVELPEDERLPLAADHVQGQVGGAAVIGSDRTLARSHHHYHCLSFVSDAPSCRVVPCHTSARRCCTSSP